MKLPLAPVKIDSSLHFGGEPFSRVTPRGYYAMESYEAAIPGVSEGYQEVIVRREFRFLSKWYLIAELKLLWLRWKYSRGRH